MRRRRIALLRRGVSATVSDRRVDVLLAHGIAAALRRTAVLRGAAAIATTAVAALAASVASTAAAAGAIVGSLVDSNCSAVKPEAQSTG